MVYMIVLCVCVLVAHIVALETMCRKGRNRKSVEELMEEYCLSEIDATIIWFRECEFTLF